MHPERSLTVTENTPLEVTRMLWVVSPFDHRYEAYPAGAERVTLPPAQKLSGPSGVITGVEGKGFTVTLISAEGRLVQPKASVTVTLYTPAVVTVILCDVWPLLHK
ncbi:hypothetical protein DSECCO2_307050 [anaerobic digester metagenome]